MNQPSREEDALNAGEGDNPLRVSCVVIANPFQSPVGLLLHSGHSLDGVEQPFSLRRLLHVNHYFLFINNNSDTIWCITHRVKAHLDECVDEETVHLAVNVLHGDLEAVEAARLGDLHLLHEPFHQVLVHDPVRGGEEGEHVRHEISLVVFQVFPVFHVLGQVDLQEAVQVKFFL